MSNTPLEQNGIDLEAVLEKVNALPQAGIIPSGSIILTEEKSYDVTEKATAVVDFSATRAALAEAVTAKGVDTLPDSSFDTIANHIGLIEGGGGLPEGISKIEVGSFTLSEDTDVANHKVYHTLGKLPVFVLLWADDMLPFATFDRLYCCKYVMSSIVPMGATGNRQVFEYTIYSKRTTGTVDSASAAYAEDNLWRIASDNWFAPNRNQEAFKAGVKYKWIAIA